MNVMAFLLFFLNVVDWTFRFATAGRAFISSSFAVLF